MNEEIKDLMQQGIDCMYVQKYEAAKAAFEKVLEADPRNAEAHLHLGNAQANLGDYDAAIATHKKGLMLDGQMAEFHYAIGCSQYLKNKPVEALKSFAKCEEMGYVSVDLYSLIASIYAGNEDFTAAMRYLNRSIALEPMNVEPRLDKARLFILEGRIAEAVNALEDVREMMPDLAEPYLVEAELHINQDDPDAALAIIDKGIKRFPEDPEMVSMKLKILNSAERYEDAEPLLDVYAAMIGDDPELAKDLALMKSVTYAGLDRADESMAALEERIEMGGDAKETSLFALLNEAMVLERFALMEKYSAELMKIEGAHPRYKACGIFWHIQALKKLGREAEAEAEIPEAISSLRKLSIENPGVFEIYSYRALVHAEAKEFEKAYELCDHVITLLGNAEAYAMKATVCDMEGVAEEAAKCRSKAAELDPSFEL